MHTKRALGAPAKGSPGTSTSKKPMWARQASDSQFTTGFRHTSGPSPWARRFADGVHDRVLVAMRLVVLHPGHLSKKSRGTTCAWDRRGAHDTDLVWNVDPTHPIAEGVPPIVVPEQEISGELRDIPAPDELIFISSFSGGEVFRRDCTFRCGYRKIFHFSPGDQEYPAPFHANIRRVIANDAMWARPMPHAEGVPELRHAAAGALTVAGDL